MVHRIIVIEGGKRVLARADAFLRRVLRIPESLPEGYVRPAPFTFAISMDPALGNQRVSIPAAMPVPTAKPRRKGLGPKQLKWLRANIEAFADMEKRAKQSRNGTIVQGKPSK